MSSVDLGFGRSVYHTDRGQRLLTQARRAVRLLSRGGTVTTRYAVAAVAAGLIEQDELLGVRTPKGRRWYLG